MALQQGHRSGVHSNDSTHTQQQGHTPISRNFLLLWLQCLKRISQSHRFKCNNKEN